MKKKILGIVIPFILALILGMICGRYVYKTYRDNIYGDLSSSRLYLIQGGKYEDYNEMREENYGSNYIYYQDEDGYKTVVGITRKYDNISKIKSLYSDDLKVMEYYLPREYLDSRQDEYDLELSDVSDLYQVRKVVDNILDLYRKDDTIKLISIS